MSSFSRFVTRLRRAGRLAVVCLAGMLALPAMAQHAVTVNTSTQFQSIEGWGTCLTGWDVNARNLYLTDAWRQAYRDAGCNILRVPVDQRAVDPNCGGTPVTFSGTLSSDANLINLDQERIAPFWTFAQWLSANALEPDRVRISASHWTPPHWMKGPTNCGGGQPKPYCSTFGGDSIGGRLIQTNDGNVQPNRQQFAWYTAAWMEKWRQKAGLPVYILSIQNEIGYENPFDSCTYQHDDACNGSAYWQWRRALRAVHDTFVANGQSIKLMGPHYAHIGDSPSNPYGLLHQTSFIQDLKDGDPTLWNALAAYNDNGYVNAANGAACYDGYWRGVDNVPVGWAAWGFPQTMHEGVGGHGKMTWISEGDGVDPTVALELAVKMHNALVLGHASAYVSWQMSDGGTAETQHTLLGSNNVSTPHRSLKYCAFKHFARYVRPGARRVAATFSGGTSTILGADQWDTNNGLSVSAFTHAGDNVTTVVVINKTGAAQSLTVNGLPGTSYARYETRSTDTDGFRQLTNLAVSGGAVALTVPAGSVTTLTGSGSGGGDTTPPAAPTGLIANAVSSSQIDLDWSDNTESDLAGYNVYRSTTSGSGYAKVNGSLVTSSAYSDTGLTASTTYYYVVRAVDTSSNESGNSNQASATTSGGCVASTDHVSSIVVSVVNVGQGNKRGQAQVTVLDNCSNPVANGTVTGNFTGSINESGRSAATNASGVATIQTSGTAKGNVNVTFCVTNVTHATLSYDANSNVETCDSGS